MEEVEEKAEKEEEREDKFTVAVCLYLGRIYCPLCRELSCSWTKLCHFPGSQSNSKELGVKQNVRIVSSQVSTELQ